MVELGYNKGFAAKLIQYGWETITEELKHNGISGMIKRLDSQSRYLVHKLSDELKAIMTPLFETHMKNILTGSFSHEMMIDWKNNDENLLRWREETGLTNFEKASPSDEIIENQDYFI